LSYVPERKPILRGWDPGLNLRGWAPDE